MKQLWCNHDQIWNHGKIEETRHELSTSLRGSERLRMTHTNENAAFNANAYTYPIMSIMDFSNGIPLRDLSFLLHLHIGNTFTKGSIKVKSKRMSQNNDNDMKPGFPIVPSPHKSVAGECKLLLLLHGSTTGLNAINIIIPKLTLI